MPAIHLLPGLPLLLVPIGFHCNILFGIPQTAETKITVHLEQFLERVRLITKSGYWVLHAYLSFRPSPPSSRMQKLGFHWMDFYEFRYFRISRKSDKKNLFFFTIWQ